MCHDIATPEQNDSLPGPMKKNGSDWSGFPFRTRGPCRGLQLSWEKLFLDALCDPYPGGKALGNVSKTRGALLAEIGSSQYVVSLTESDEQTGLRFTVFRSAS